MMYNKNIAEFWPITHFVQVTQILAVSDLIINRKQSCGKVIFSQVSVCPLGEYVSSYDHKVPLARSGYVQRRVGWVCPGEG